MSDIPEWPESWAFTGVDQLMCPFCKERVAKTIESGVSAVGAFVHCTKCSADGPWGVNRHDAEYLWAQAFIGNTEAVVVHDRLLRTIADIASLLKDVPGSSLVDRIVTLLARDVEPDDM